MVKLNMYALLALNVLLWPLRRLQSILTRIWGFLALILRGAYFCTRSNYKAYTEQDRDFEQQIEFLTVCNTCSFREGSRCGACGCLLTLKVQDPENTCPLGMWNDMSSDDNSGHE